jgi:hypothetical protein
MLTDMAGISHKVLTPNNFRMLKKGPVLTRPPRCAETHPSIGKAAASEEARRTLRYVEPLSDARTLQADFFSILSVDIEMYRIADIKNSPGGE